ncbi:ABC transporter permease [Candidatus Pacearchaeota archaeon]|nr:ABC transporter permease [Candidatus Pacearchaeota archaeon]
MKTYFILASKNLKRKKLRSWLTLIGIFIGIAAVVSLISLGNTLKAAVNSQFDIGARDIISVQAGGVGWAGPPGSAVSTPLIEEDTNAIERIGSVEYATSRLIRTLKSEFNDKVSFISATSLPDNKRISEVFRELDISIEDLEYGRLLREGERGKIIIGNNIADGKRNGFGKDIRINDKILLNDQEFRVAGIFERKGSFTIDSVVLMSEVQLRELTNLTNEVDLISVKVKNIELIDFTKEEIEKLMRIRRNVRESEEDFTVSTPESALASVNQILLGIQIFIVIIAAISIVVGAIGIANTMATSVLERRKEIGTMKAVGARNKNIFYQFLVEAGLLGLIGGIIGVSLGIGISYLGTTSLHSFLGITTKPSIDFILIFLSLMGSFLIGAVSGIIPAMKAARENPVEAIRG